MTLTERRIAVRPVFPPIIPRWRAGGRPGRKIVAFRRVGWGKVKTTHPADLVPASSWLGNTLSIALVESIRSSSDAFSALHSFCQFGGRSKQQRVSWSHCRLRSLGQATSLKSPMSSCEIAESAARGAVFSQDSRYGLPPTTQQLHCPAKLQEPKSEIAVVVPTFCPYSSTCIHTCQFYNPSAAISLSAAEVYQPASFS